ncbi:glycosyltransferase family A protein [Hymenobacter monticola]|uniref:Glycosyltransferase family 2 protein n=1 Tax=Hymenobacter monticola TaxID=1705399 RepID=A0ABY4B2C8_9BACT|nr:glycosyltransferase family A protein [Hymenobacter monticola]UOE31861.1 glycosyltransferase family 2 protein [Hymenobacter monticola]
MSDISLSYVLTTYNKLPYLRQVLERLVLARQTDEEIVVADGGSQDGTCEYLQGLFDAGLIQQYASERDKGEAHGFNKAMLRARGELLKLITDDDAFCYPAIQEAKAFMLNRPELDVLTGHAALMHVEELEKATFYDDVADNFRRWLTDREVVWLIGLPLMIRRSSLALTGLFHTGVVQVDAEFTYRITSLGVNLAWSSALLSVRLENPQSNLRRMNQGPGGDASRREGDRMRFYYDPRIGNGLWDYFFHKSGWVDQVKKPLRPAWRALLTALKRPVYHGNSSQPTGYVPGAGPLDPSTRLATAFAVAHQLMTDYNAARPTQFLFRQNSLTKTLG